MSKIANQIASALSKLEKSNKLNAAQRISFIEATVARIISLQLQLPSSPIDYPTNHYYDTHVEVVMKAVADINENYIIDTERVEQLVKAFYLMRYNLVFNARDCSLFLAVAVSSATNVIPPKIADLVVAINDIEVETAFREIIAGYTLPGA